MSEFIKSSDYLYSPEYWDGHTFGDECEPAEIKLFGAGLGEMIRMQSAYQVEAARLLRDYDADAEDTPLSEFGAGTTFVLSNYPVGTIIRETAEDFSYIDDNTEQYEPSKSDRGIIVASKKYKDIKQIVGFDKDGEVQGVRMFGLGSQEIEVGTTEHFKLVGTSPKIVFGGTELLHKPTKIEVLQMGKGDKSPVHSPGNGFTRLVFGRQNV